MSLFKHVFVSKDENGVLVTTGIIELNWIDDFLVWNDSDLFLLYKEFTVQLPAAQIWIPSISVANSANELQLITPHNNSQVSLSHSGGVMLLLSAKFETSCELEVKK